MGSLLMYKIIHYLTVSGYQVTHCTYKFIFCLCLSGVDPTGM